MLQHGLNFDPIANAAWKLGSTTTKVAGGGQDGCQELQMLRFAELSSIWSMVRLRAHPASGQVVILEPRVQPNALRFRVLFYSCLAAGIWDTALSGRLQQKVYQLRLIYDKSLACWSGTRVVR